VRTVTGFRIRALLVPVAGAVIVLAAALIVRTGTPAVRPGHPAGAVATGDVTVAIVNYGYTPARVTVQVGTRVTWTNHDPTAHTATADGGAFDTGTIAPHHSSTETFTKLGTYPYHCLFHAFMTGTVTVVR
jgi:plastocyanin